MDDVLKKIDQIKNRTGVSYGAAKEALDKCGGDVLDAIILLENQHHAPERPAMEHGKEIWHGLQEVVQTSKDTKIRVMKEGKQVAEVPAAVGVLGIVGALANPGLAAIGAVGSVAALLNKYSLEVKKDNNEASYNARENDIDKVD